MRAFCVLIYDLAAPIKVGERSVAIKVWQQRQQRDGDGEMNLYVKEPRGRNEGDLCSAGRHGTHLHGNRPCGTAPSSSSFSCFTSSSSSFSSCSLSSSSSSHSHRRGDDWFLPSCQAARHPGENLPAAVDQRHVFFFSDPSTRLLLPHPCS